METNNTTANATDSIARAIDSTPIDWAMLARLEAAREAKRQLPIHAAEWGMTVPEFLAYRAEVKRQNAIIDAKDEIEAAIEALPSLPDAA